MNNVKFQDKIDASNRSPKKFTTQKEKVILLSALDRNNPESKSLYETQVSLKFWDDEAKIMDYVSVYIEDITHINYVVRNEALSYFCDLNYSEKPEDVQKFIEATKNKSWYLDSVVL